MSFNTSISSVQMLVEKDCTGKTDDVTPGTLTSSATKRIYNCEGEGEGEFQGDYKTTNPVDPLNDYGFTDDDFKKPGYQFVVGATFIDADISVNGVASVSANVGDVIEVAADVEAVSHMKTVLKVIKAVCLQPQQQKTDFGLPCFVVHAEPDWRLALCCK